MSPDLLGQPRLLAADLVGGHGQPAPGPGDRLVGVGPGVTQHRLDLPEPAAGLGRPATRLSDTSSSRAAD
jgi:hypothetical protein